MGNIAALVEFIVHKTTILGRCNNDSCDNAYGNYLAIAIFSTVISIFLSVCENFFSFYLKNNRYSFYYYFIGAFCCGN